MDPIPQSLSAADAYVLLLSTVKPYEEAVASIDAYFTQDQFNALVGLRYNVGTLGSISGLLSYLEEGVYNRSELTNIVKSHYDAIINKNSQQEKYRPKWYNRTERIMDIFFDRNYGDMPIDAVSGKVRIQ